MNFTANTPVNRVVNLLDGNRKVRLGRGKGGDHNLGGCRGHRSMKSVSVASVQEMLPGGCH